MTAPETPPDTNRPPLIAYRPLIALGAAVVIAILTGAGLISLAELRRQVAIVALPPTPITAMRDWSPVAVKGQVAEVFGNKFILTDESSRALIETGPEGEGGNLVAPSETVTVQGRFEQGFVHARAITHADGRSDVLGPPGPPPPPGLLSWRGVEGVAHRWLPHWRHG